MVTTIHKLKNGIPVVLEENKKSSTAVVYVGVGIGSVYEKENEYGLAHFFEHMCFKGTKTRKTPREILEHIDRLGLSANACTGFETTAYHLKGRSVHINEMLEITSDLFLNSLFSEGELEKERGVILQEIAMYEDDPASKAEDVIIANMFRGTVVEHKILGTRELVSSFTREQFINFLNKHYTTGNTIISVAGAFDTKEVIEKMETLFSKASKGEYISPPEIRLNNVIKTHHSVLRKELEQTQILIGGYAPSMTSQDKYATAVFSALFGGSMSSRLFSKIREELGACYSVGANSFALSGCGMFFIQTGIDSERMDEVMRAIAGECMKIKTLQIEDDELEKAKEIVLSRAAFKTEDNLRIASSNFTKYLYMREIQSLKMFEKKIKAITKEEITRLANTILDKDKMSVCYVGNKKVDKSLTEQFLTAVG